jgi:tetratricopeptide (TPR) repeat protein
LTGYSEPGARLRSKGAIFPVSVSVIVLVLEICATARADDDYRAMWERGEYAGALVKLEERHPIDSLNRQVGLLRDRAELRFLTGRVEEAVSDLEQLCERRPTAPGLVRLAEMQRYRGRVALANDALEKAAWESDRWIRYASREDIALEPENLLARGRVMELRGNDAKDILTGIYKGLMDLVPDFAAGFIAAGNLALSKGSYGTSSGYFQGALDIEPQSQEALAGLAACYWQARDGRAVATLERLEALNPNHPAGMALRIEMLLDARSVSDAHRLIDQGLAINPRQLQFQALRAAAFFLEDRIDDMKRVQRNALAFNPGFSDVYRVPGRLASRHYRFREGSGLQRQALTIDPDDHEARAQLGLDLLRLGDDDAGREELEAAFKADPYRVQVFNSLKVLDTLETFHTASRGPWVLRLPAHEAPVLADTALELLEEAASLLAPKYGVDLDTPVHVQIFDNHDDFMARSIGLPGNAGHLGICFGNLITMDSPSARPKGSSDWHAVLWHEFTHVITLQKTNNRMPRWLSEGISVFEETQRNPGWGMRLDPNYRQVLDTSGIPGVSDLERYFTQPASPGHLMFGYFVSGEFVAYYVNTYGQAALVSALEQIGQGGATLDALAAAANTSTTDLDAAFQQYLTKRMAMLHNLEPFAAALRRGIDAQRAAHWEQAEAAFQEAHALYPEYTGEADPLASLAELYARTGRREQLRATLEAQLGLHTANWHAWRRLAAEFEEMKDWPALERTARAAAAIDPFDVNMTRMLLRAQRELGSFEAALATIERLVGFDQPRAAEYKLARIEALIALERWDEAKRHTVLLLEEMPSFWDAQAHLLALAEQTEDYGT